MEAFYKDPDIGMVLSWENGVAYNCNYYLVAQVQDIFALGKQQSLKNNDVFIFI